MQTLQIETCNDAYHFRALHKNLIQNYANSLVMTTIIISFCLNLYSIFFRLRPKQVTGVVGRAETLSSVFFLIAFMFYVKSTHVKKKRLKSKCECVCDTRVCLITLLLKRIMCHVCESCVCVCVGGG